jgi:hypothetical protein
VLNSTVGKFSEPDPVIQLTDQKIQIRRSGYGILEIGIISLLYVLPIIGNSFYSKIRPAWLYIC